MSFMVESVDISEIIGSQSMAGGLQSFQAMDVPNSQLNELSQALPNGLSDSQGFER